MDLITLAEFTALTGKTTNATLITAGSEAIALYCNRDFLLRTRVEWHDGGADFVNVRHYPVTSIFSVARGEAAAATVRYTGAGGMPCVIVKADGVTLKSFVAGAVVSSTILFADKPTIQGVIEAVAAVAGWQCETRLPGALAEIVPSIFLRPIVRAGNIGNSGFAVDLLFADVAVDASLEPGTNRMLRFDCGAIQPGNVAVWYEAGYANTAAIPADLKAVCAQIVSEMADLMASGAIESERIGDYAYTLKKTETFGNDVFKRNAETLYRYVIHVI